MENKDEKDRLRIIIIIIIIIIKKRSYSKYYFDWLAQSSTAHH